jgi:hypothetical protein
MRKDTETGANSKMHLQVHQKSKLTGRSVRYVRPLRAELAL